MNIKQRARELLTCDELRGRVPEEVRQFLSDVVALEPVGYTLKDYFYLNREYGVEWTVWDVAYAPNYEAIYRLGAPNDPA